MADNYGKVVQVIGPTVDVEFHSDNLPAILNALVVEDPSRGDHGLVVEVAQHLGNDIVRCVAMDGTDGLVRGMRVRDTGSAITVPVGEDIGFLPGTEEEKMTPWMGALMDNLEVLTQTEGGEWGRAATDDLLRSRIRIHSLNYMRGRTFLNKYIILDEAQNLTAKQMKTLITRAGLRLPGAPPERDPGTCPRVSGRTPRSGTAPPRAG